MSEQTPNQTNGPAASAGDDPHQGPAVKAPVTPVQAMNRHQLLDALCDMIPKHQLPKEVPR